MRGRAYPWLVSSAAVLLVGLSALAMGSAQADPSGSGTTPTTSTSDELADMVMDVVESGLAPAPTTSTVIPAPPPQ